MILDEVVDFEHIELHAEILKDRSWPERRVVTVRDRLLKQRIDLEQPEELDRSLDLPFNDLRQPKLQRLPSQADSLDLNGDIQRQILVNFLKLDKLQVVWVAKEAVYVMLVGVLACKFPLYLFDFFSGNYFASRDLADAFDLRDNVLCERLVDLRLELGLKDGVSHEQVALLPVQVRYLPMRRR